MDTEYEKNETDWNHEQNLTVNTDHENLKQSPPKKLIFAKLSEVWLDHVFKKNGLKQKLRASCDIVSGMLLSCLHHIEKKIKA